MSSPIGTTGSVVNTSNLLISEKKVNPNPNRLLDQFKRQTPPEELAKLRAIAKKILEEEKKISEQLIQDAVDSIFSKT